MGQYTHFWAMIRDVRAHVAKTGVKVRSSDNHERRVIGFEAACAPEDERYGAWEIRLVDLSRTGNDRTTVPIDGLGEEGMVALTQLMATAQGRKQVATALSV